MEPTAMAPALKYSIKALGLVPLMFLLFSCGSYNRQISNYYSQVVNNEFENAYTSIDRIRKLQAGRNRLLYLLEKGKMAHLTSQYEASNRYFNEADYFMEDARTSVKDIALGTLLNPMMQTYKGEDFEKFMVHYYKTLNYLSLNNTSEALVEARRISLQSYSQQEKTKGYSDDAFSLMLQGIVYEQSGDVNNAFVAYRNAAEVYLKNKNSYYGVTMPDQLKKDVVRTALLNRFSDEADRYRKLFNLEAEADAKAAGGELVLFWENGLAPVKREANFFFSLNKDGAGNFAFTDAAGSLHIPFNLSNSSNSNLNVNDFRSLRLAFPAYEERPVYYRNAVINVNESRYSFETAQDINTLAKATLRERFLKEAATALSRMVIKKLAEEAVRPDKDDKKKNEKEAAAIALQVFNFVSEKADTRNWQSLPHTIYYTRIPLQKGSNTIRLVLGEINNGSKTIELKAEGNGGLQVKNICTLK